MQPKPIPRTHLDLIDGTLDAVLTTVMPDGQPQTTPVWLNRMGDYLYINTMRDYRKEKDMRQNPRVTLLIYDPMHPLKNIEIRGEVVEMTEQGALEHLDQLTCLYMGRSDAHFFGDCVPVEYAEKYTPVKVKIAPVRVRIEG